MSFGRHVVSSVSQLHDLAARFVADVGQSATLLLYGELGSGKTTFVQGVARCLGIDEQVVSPSFTVVAEYVAHHAEMHRLVHADLYRLSDGADDPSVASVLEQVGVPGVLVVIEWADRLGDIRIPGAFVLLFEYGSAVGERIVTFKH